MKDIKDNRPLSPHVGIYRWQITNTLSILHRVTGFALSLGLLPLTLWLWSAAYHPSLSLSLMNLFASIPGKLLLTGWLAAFYYHLGNGIRHLNWDIGKGFTNQEVAASGQLVVVFTLSLTIFTWAMIYRSVGF